MLDRQIDELVSRQRDPVLATSRPHPHMDAVRDQGRLAIVARGHPTRADAKLRRF